MKVNFKWPKTKENNFYPWYIILKNVAFLPLFALGASIASAGMLVKVTGFSICYLYLCMVDSVAEANKWWKQANE